MICPHCSFAVDTPNHEFGCKTSAGQEFGLMAVLPKARYVVRETTDGWEVYGDVNPSFT